MTDLFPIDLAQQIACADRELRMRLQVYPRRVANKQMSQAKADHEIAAMTAILKTLCDLKEKNHVHDQSERRL